MLEKISEEKRDMQRIKHGQNPDQQSISVQVCIFIYLSMHIYVYTYYFSTSGGYYAHSSVLHFLFRQFIWEKFPFHHTYIIASK